MGRLRAPMSIRRRPQPGATPPTSSTPMASPTWTWSPALHARWEQELRPRCREQDHRGVRLGPPENCVHRPAVTVQGPRCPHAGNGRRSGVRRRGPERPVLTELRHGRRAESWNSTQCPAVSPGGNQLRLASRRASASSSSRQMMASSPLTSSQAESSRCPAEEASTVSFLTWASILQIMLWVASTMRTPGSIHHVMNILLLAYGRPCFQLSSLSKKRSGELVIIGEIQK